MRRGHRSTEKPSSGDLWPARLSQPQKQEKMMGRDWRVGGGWGVKSCNYLTERQHPPRLLAPLAAVVDSVVVVGRPLRSREQPTKSDAKQSSSVKTRIREIWLKLADPLEEIWLCSSFSSLSSLLGWSSPLPRISGWEASTSIFSWSLYDRHGWPWSQHFHHKHNCYICVNYFASERCFFFDKTRFDLCASQEHLIEIWMSNVFAIPKNRFYFWILNVCKYGRASNQVNSQRFIFSLGSNQNRSTFAPWLGLP